MYSVLTLKQLLFKLPQSSCNIISLNCGKCVFLELWKVNLRYFPVLLWAALQFSLFLLIRKQRKKLHDHLRQSLRNKRNNNTSISVGPNLASLARGRQISNLPLQDLQLINVCFYSLLSNERHFGPSKSVHNC